MSTVTDANLDDLVAATLNDLGSPKIQMIAQDIQDYFVMGRMMKKEKVIFSGGKGIQKTLMLKRNKTASHKGRYAEDKLDIPNLLQTLTVPWVHIDDGWGYDIAEVRQNKGNPKLMINDILKPRRANCLLNIIEDVELKFWGAAPSTTDVLHPRGIKYWIVKNATAGFNGGAPGSHTTVGGINPTTCSNWNNWTDQYTDVSVDDLIDKMSLACFKIKFKSPIDVADMKTSSNTDYRICTSYTTYNKIKRLTQQQNDNLGADLDKFNGELRFNRFPIEHIAQLEDGADAVGTTENDVYFINFKSFYPVILKDSYMRETKPKVAANQHNVREAFIDLDYNFICVDRRANAVIQIA